MGFDSVPVVPPLPPRTFIISSFERTQAEKFSIFRVFITLIFKLIIQGLIVVYTVHVRKCPFVTRKNELFIKKNATC